MPPPGVCLNIMEARQKQEGYGSLLNPSLLFSQDYQKLKEFCVTRRVKFIDDMFPPDRKSIGQGILSPSDLARVVWLRPAKISQNPTFVLHGFSRFDFDQGVLGNCWFLASIGALTFQDHIFRQVAPAKQGFDENYCGLFHFMFWRFGKWVDVVIDDKLPTINGRLVFVQSKNQNEFWPALLEKAYAKVCGSYTDMNVGTPAEAMVDFTGGVHMCIQLSDPPPDLWELMSRAGNFGALLGCSTPQKTSITGKLNSEEFIRLWNKVVIYKDIFFQTDVSRTGTLSLTELRNAFVASGMRVSDDMLNLMALCYGASSGHMTLESFISLILRLECMFKIFRQLSDGKTMTLQESEWIYVSMYT